jgi:hypothetical protein
VVAPVQRVHFCVLKVFGVLSDSRASRRNTRLTASMLLPFKSGRRSKISASSAVATVAFDVPLLRPPTSRIGEPW